MGKVMKYIQQQNQIFKNDLIELQRVTKWNNMKFKRLNKMSILEPKPPLGFMEKYCRKALEII